ncbi:GEVED domain-containing protein [Shewanella marina]|uniref:GEVED domain-containing protein n=1 Tax=Shewanella marina TaxID=487319 RepID=UPI00046F0D45|nr:GEVED domain-containing protein [Shewanella marina]
MIFLIKLIANKSLQFVTALLCLFFIFFSSSLYAQQCNSGFNVSNGQYYFDGDGGNGWGTRSLNVSPTGLFGGTGSGGRIIVDSHWGWNNGNQWTGSNNFTETIHISLIVNGITVARLSTPSNSQNTASLASQGGASFLNGGGNVNVTGFDYYGHHARILLPSSITSVYSVQLSATQTPHNGSGGWFGGTSAAGDDGGIRVNNVIQCGFEATDAPSSYGIAKHNNDTVASNLRLGANVSLEASNLSSNLANADSYDDGISNFPQDMIDAGTGAVNLVASVVNGSGSSTDLVGWVDWDQDNAFQVDEAVAITVPAAGSSNSDCTNTSGNNFSCNLNYVVDVADRGNAGYFFARFRVASSLTTSTISTSVNGGEVEDYRFCIGCFDISGSVYIDENADSSISGDSVTTSQVAVRLYLDDGDGVPSAGDTLYAQQNTSNGSYSFTEVPVDTYFIAVAAPALSGAVAEQTYAASNTYVGALCDSNADASSGDAPQTSSGACYGGRDGDRIDATTNVTTREHISKVDLSFASSNQANVDFGFSYNVVTNTSANGQGSVEQFIRNANALSGANSMRFVPAIPANDIDAGADWWIVNPTTTLRTITGTNGANTTLDGTAYSHTDGVTVLDTNPGNYSDSFTVGSSDGCSVESIAALAKPEMQIHLPTSTSAYSAEIFSVNADNTTIKNFSLTGGSIAINVYSAGITDSLFEQNLIGIDPAGNDDVIGQDTCGTSTGCAGIAIAHPSNASLSGSTGTIQNNAIRTAHNNLSFGNLNSQTTSGHWLVQHNQLLGTTSTSGSYVYYNLYIRYGIPGYLEVIGNQLTDVTGDGIYQLGTSNTALTQTFTSNSIDDAAGAGIHMTSGYSDVIQCNVIHDNGGAGVSIDGNTNVDGYLISKNSFDGNTLNAIDLHSGATGAGVSLNSDLCNADNTGGANNNLARPQVNYAFLTGSNLRVIGDVCGTGSFTLEVYKASSGSGDTGSDAVVAGEGLTYLGEITGISSGSFDQAISVTGLNVGDEVTLIAQRTNAAGLGLLQDTSEFSGNVIVDTDDKDWGDAPDISAGTAEYDYQTLRINNGANHVVKDSNGDNTPDVILGSLIDEDINGLQSMDAQGDNITDDNDEDGATAEGFYVLNQPRDIQVTITKDPTLATSTFHLHAWFDWNRDGDWDDANEHVINESAAPAGTANYTINTPSDANLGVSFARFRVCSSGDCNTPYGASSDGEVEDYSRIIISLDFGDAPDTGVGVSVGNYRTLESDDGPRHETTPDLYLGTSADTETDGLQNSTATGDNADNENDEASLTLPPLSAGAGAYSAAIATHNATGADAYVYAWLDVDYSGSFDRDELITNGTGTNGELVISDGTTSETLTWASISGITNNSSVYLRVRVSPTQLTDSATGSDEDPRSYGRVSGGEVEDYRLQVADQDFGDLADSYQTLALSGGPYHGLSNQTNLYIGSNNIDSEANGQPSTDANDDDDNDNPDENAFASTPAPILALTASDYNVPVPVYNNTGGDVNLSGWLDWNGNNQFDVAEYATVVVPTGTTITNPVTLTFSGISGQSGNKAALRLRLSTDDLAASAWGGTASDGEVEDHYIPVGNFDFGDAEDSQLGTATGAGDYRSRLVDNGPYHGVVNTLYIGTSQPDADPDAYPSTAATYANGDDDNDVDDESDILLPPLTTTASSYLARATVHNSTGSLATLHGWIDWDRNGQFEQDEYSSATVTTGTTGTVDLTWNSFTGRTTGWTVARFRLTTDTLINGAGSSSAEDTRSLGLALDGEVEDYRIYIGNHDTGDAPNSYLTLALDGGPCHAMTSVSTLYLGSTANDSNVDGQPSSDALGDDNDGVDDEDGITEPLPLLLLSDANYNVNIKHRNNTASPATMVAWLDKNQNGQFETDEVFDGFAINNVAASTNELVTGRDLVWSGLSGQTQGTMALRVRYSHDPLGNDAWGGPASDGEVEDYIVYVGQFDFGDAADASSGANSTSNYRSRLVDSGAYHGINNNLYMGASAPDAEADSYNSVGAAMADGDDLDINGDDEDGVQLLPLDNSPVPSSYTAKVNVTNNTGSEATLHGWIDWDRNGHFDGDEHTSMAIADGTSATQDLVWTSFTGITAGETVARFRLTTDALVNTQTSSSVEDSRSINGATDGEVEDHRLYIGNQDLGDAPTSYLTLADDLGPFHGQALYSTLYLGNAGVNEGDADGQPDAAALGDDNDGSDDEQAINQPLAFVQTTANSYSVAVKLRNSTANDATLTAWLDKDQNGQFSSDEVVTTVDGAPWAINNIAAGSNYSTDATAITLTWNGLSGLNQGSMALRLRLANDPLTANQWFGQALNGEVEDYLVYVGDFDFGDASDSGAGANSTSNYRTTLADLGPYHGIDSDLYLGLQTPDSESDANNSLGSALANADDLTNDDDEDGITLFPFDNSPAPTTYTARATVTNNTGADATLHGWIDWDRNGHFDEDEHTSITVSSGTSNGELDLVWNSPYTSISAGHTVARFRLTTDTLTNSASSSSVEDTRSMSGASNGEVEDHILYIGNQDMGDAPDTYRTLAASDGPYHGQANYTTLYLGTAGVNEGDANGQPSADSLGDDLDGSDDEQALNQPLAIVPTSTTTYSVPVRLRNGTSTPATVVAWLDTNQDGFFSADEVVDTIDTSPFAINNLSAGQTANTDASALDFEWTGLSGLTQGQMALRIRISNDPLTADDWYGQASNGEVEDYMVYIGDYDFGDAPDTSSAIGVNNYQTLLSNNGPRHLIIDNLFIA